MPPARCSLMLEVASSGEEHRDTRGFGDGNDLAVSNRSARLHDRGDTGGDSCFNSIREREKCITGENAAPGPIAGSLDGDMHALDPVRLTTSHASDSRLFRKNNCIRFDMARGFPREHEIPKLGISRLAAGYDLPCGWIIELIVGVLEQE